MKGAIYLLHYEFSEIHLIIIYLNVIHGKIIKVKKIVHVDQTGTWTPRSTDNKKVLVRNWLTDKMGLSLDWPRGSLGQLA